MHNCESENKHTYYIQVLFFILLEEAFFLKKKIVNANGKSNYIQVLFLILLEEAFFLIYKCSVMRNPID